MVLSPHHLDVKVLKRHMHSQWTKLLLGAVQLSIVLWMPYIKYRYFKLQMKVKNVQKIIYIQHWAQA